MPEQWAELIRSKWQDNVKGIFDVGLMLCNAREQLGPAKFWVMVREELKFDKSTVSRLMTVASDQKLLEVGHGQLPPSYRTLYALTRLTDEEFAGLATSPHGGRVHA